MDSYPETAIDPALFLTGTYKSLQTMCNERAWPQQCWKSCANVCTALPTLLGHERSLRIDYKDLGVVFFPRCIAGPKLVGSCYIRLHITTNTHATTPNIVCVTMLGVVAPVCTQPKA